MSGSWSRFASTGVPSSSEGANIQRCEAAFGACGKAALDNANVMVIGGGEPGIGALEGENEVLKLERLLRYVDF
jgi:hypothetical protein